MKHIPEPSPPFLLVIVCVLITALYFLTGCAGEVPFDSEVPDTAMQRYIDAGGSSIHVYDTGATTPVTVTAYPDGHFFVHSIGNCNVSWDVQQLDPVNWEFWMTQPVTVTYDADLFVCAGNTYRCTGTSSVVGGVADTPVTCAIVP